MDRGRGPGVRTLGVGEQRLWLPGWQCLPVTTPLNPSWLVAVAVWTSGLVTRYFLFFFLKRIQNQNFYVEALFLKKKFKHIKNWQNSIMNLLVLIIRSQQVSTHHQFGFIYNSPHPEYFEVNPRLTIFFVKIRTHVSICNTMS